MGNKLVKSSLQHAGVKGMKWGVRNEEKVSAPAPSYPAVSTLLRNPSRMPAGEHNTERLKLEIEENHKNKITDFSQIPRFDPRTEAMSDAVKKVNEAWGYETSEIPMGNNTWTNNCPSTTMAYELRRRGYDVEAGMTGGLTRGEIGEMWGISEEELFKNKGIPPKSFEQLTEEMKAMGPGARGFCMMSWKKGSAHICSFEVSASGEVIFLDAQTGRSSINTKSDSEDNPANYYKRAKSYNVFRVDNRKPDEYLVKNMVRLDDRQQAKTTRTNLYPTDKKVKDLLKDKMSDISKKKASDFMRQPKGKSVK